MSELSYLQRDRAESFGAVADDYDRLRPSYPPALIDDLAALQPANILDVGCGTGKAATLLAARGLDVLGVEVDPAMAAVARGHGVTVEVASFESWDDAGRRFDLITCGQAWHWVDPAAGIPKAARLLQPSGGTPGNEGVAAGGGTLALFWNYADLDPSARQVLDEVYERLAPELARSVVMGGQRQGERRHSDELRDSGLFATVEQRDYPWEHVYTAAEWVALVQTHSDHRGLPPERRAGLVAALQDAVDGLDGRLAAHYRTYATFARVPG